MRYTIVLLLVLMGISAEAPAQTYGLDNTNPAVFSKFTIPKTELRALWFGGSFYATTQKNSNLATAGPNSNSFSNNINGVLSPRYYFLNESDENYLRLMCNVDGTYSYNDNRSEGPGINGTRFRKMSSQDLTLLATEVFRNYPSGGDLFYSLNSNVQADLSNQYYEYPISDSTHYAYYNGTKTQFYSFSVGLGWGKMRNVTAVVSAIRFQERMKQLNLLNSNFSEKTIEDLAQQFYRQGYYSMVHVRPEKYFWQGVEKTLAADGVSLAGLNQYADSYLREVPNELRFSRNEGIVGGFGLRFDYSNHYYSAYVNPPNGSISEEFLTLGNAYVDFSHQLDLNSQLNFDLSVNGGPNLTKHSGVRQQYEMAADVGYHYELTDRVVTSAGESFDLMFQNSGTHGRNLSNTASLGLDYFVEDNVSLGASYSWNYLDNNGMDGSPAHFRNIYNQLNVNVTYYIDRGFMYPN